jgi:hypothetical protein
MQIETPRPDEAEEGTVPEEGGGDGGQEGGGDAGGGESGEEQDAS